MVFALLMLVSSAQAPVGPSLPAGSNPDTHRAFNLIEADLAGGHFDSAKAKLKLLPNLTVTFSWNDANIPEASKPEWITARTNAFKTLTTKIPGLTFKQDAKPALKFSFEKSLAADPDSGLPRGIALFYSEALNEPRLEAVIGINRGNPLERANPTSIYNEVLFAVGSYLGLNQGPFIGTAMGRVDMQMQYTSAFDLYELGAINSIQKAAEELKKAVAQKRALSPAKPKAGFNPEMIEKGPVIQGAPLEFSVQVSNLGNAPVQFRVIPDCGCVTAGTVPPVQPGGSVAVPIKVNTSEILGELNKHLILISNDSEQPIRKFPIKIKTIPRYRFLSEAPNILIIEDKGLDTDVFLVSPKEKPLEITGVEVIGNPGSATFEPWQGDLPDPELNEPSKPRFGYKIKLHLDEPQVSGRSAATLVVKTKDPTYPVVRYSVFAQRGIAALPASIFFGDLGKAERQASLILTRPNKPFKILKVESDSSFVTADATLTRDKWEYKLICRYNGKAPLGDLTAFLTVHTDDAKQSKIRIAVMGTVR